MNEISAHPHRRKLRRDGETHDDGEKKDLRRRPYCVPKFKLWLKPKLVVGVVGFVGRLTVPAMALADAKVN